MGKSTVTTRRTIGLLCLMAAVLPGLGWCVGEWRARNADAEMRHRLRQQAIYVAQSLDPDMVKALSFSAADKDAHAFQYIRQQMTALARYIAQRGIYSMALRNGRLIFGPENYAEDDPMSSPPGTLYEEPAREIFDCFAKSSAVTTGPYSDEYGEFVSAFAPVYDLYSGEVLMVVGIDTLANDWDAVLRAERRESVLGSLIPLGVLLAGAGVYAARRRCGRAGMGLGDLSPGRRERAGRDVGPSLLIGVGILTVTFLGVALQKTWHWTCEHIDQTVNQQARLAVEFDRALRNYVGKHIRPEMEKRVAEGEFIPEAMSTSFVARSVFDEVRKTYPDAVLRFASTNPRNPSNRATPAEESLIRYFEQHPGVEEWTGTMEFFEQSGKYFVCAIPRRFETSCLQCHGRPQDAPASLLERYGAIAGFERSVGDVSVDLAAIPVSASYTAARAQVWRHMLSALTLCVLFLVGIIVLITVDTRRRRDAEMAVEKERSFLRLVIDTIPGFVFVKSREGRYVMANQALAKAHGVTVQAIEGRTNAHLAASEAQADSRRRDDMEVIDAKTTKVIPEEPVTYADGTTHWITTTKVPLIGDDGACSHLLAVATDITERRQVEEELQKLASVVRHSDEIVNIAGLDGRMMFLNEAGARMLGIAPEEVEHTNIRQTMPDHLQAKLEHEVLPALMAGGEWNGDLQYCNLRTGQLIDVHTASFTVTDPRTGSPLYLANVSLDVTERKRAEEELRRHHDHLEELVRERTEALVRAKSEAEAANRAKSAFLANMSHEIRTPMNAILGFSQLMQRDPELTPQQKQHLDTISRSGELLLAIINDILEMSKIEAGRMTLNPTTFDLPALVHDLEAMFRVRAEAKGLKFTTEIAPDVLHFGVADENKLRQIFINLLGNAVKFTNRGQVVWRLRTENQGRGAVRLVSEVEDTGPGIAAGDIGRLFRAFEQTQIGARTAGGSGLGLAISQQLARLMGGQITVESEFGQGSCFRVNVGIQEGQAAPATDQAAHPRVLGLKPGQPSYRVLVADDGRENRILLSEMLKGVGFDVLEVRDGREALACFDRWKPHLVLLDMCMPIVDGYEACRDIKATEEGRKTRVVAVTASTLDSARQLVWQSGVDAYLGKPFKEHELFDVIRTCLPVEYVYEGDVAPPAAAPAEGDTLGPDDLAESVAALPPGLVEALRQATIRTDLHRLRDLIRDVEKQSPRLAAHLLELANHYQYLALTRLLGDKLCVK